MGDRKSRPSRPPAILSVARKKPKQKTSGDINRPTAGLSPVTCSKLGATRHLLKKASASGSTTSSLVTLPPALMAATTSECVFPSTAMAFTWSERPAAAGQGRHPRHVFTGHFPSFPRRRPLSFSSPWLGIPFFNIIPVSARGSGGGGGVCGRGGRKSFESSLECTYAPKRILWSVWTPSSSPVTCLCVL